ncbi:MAG: hypothetical protein KC620_01140 [Myxococcales bacterium]|nr:hypothetical protein [Myxococcales bacterium]
MRVELRLRWLWLPASLAIVFLLRHHKLALVAYVVAVLLGLIVWLVVLPRRAALAERTFHRDALRRLAAEDHAGVEALAARQWLIRRFGRRFVLPDMLGLVATARGDHEAAHRHYLEALKLAPPGDRERIELNLAAAELATGRLDAAEGRYRAILARRADLQPALANLGRTLLRKGEELAEAADLLARALERADRREAGGLHLARAEALARAGRPGWRSALDAAQTEEALGPGDAERITALASAHGAPSD